MNAGSGATPLATYPLNSVESARPHLPVLLREVLVALAPRDGEVYVDGTFGAGGYSRAVLQAAGSLVGVDRDPEALIAAADLEAEFPGRFKFLQGCFGDLDALLEDNNVTEIHGVMLDLGVSSMQLDQAERGFSFMRDGPLDMRMSQSGVSASDVVNGYDEQDLATILYVYGEERRSRAIAKAIVTKREQAPITRTFDLVELVTSVLGHPRGKKKGAHPATRTFQALRIFLNNELGELIRGLMAAEKCLAPGGRLVVVTFHSLEDRIVKKFLTARTGQGGRPSRYMPDVETQAPSFESQGKRSVSPSDEEVSTNSRSRSARLRSAVRTTAAPWPEDDLLPRNAPQLEVLS